jgi:hypothetical protein
VRDLAGLAVVADPQADGWFPPPHGQRLTTSVPQGNDVGNENEKRWEKVGKSEKK